MTAAPTLNERLNALTGVTPIAPYDGLAIGWHHAAWSDKSRILLATGSKGGGKSRFAAEKVHAFCLKYKGATGLVVRKTRETLTNSTVLFMQQKIIGADARVVYMEGKHRFEYKHNDSFLAYGGMKDADQREQVRSMGANGGLDIIWMEEANAFEESDFSELIGCLRGNAAPWRQIIMTTNPDGPDHWIRRKFILPATEKLSERVYRGCDEHGNVFTVYYSGAQDNPFNPPDYQSTLSLLTGLEYQRLVLGQWVQAEGVVFDNFSTEDGANVLAMDYTPNAPLFWGVDDGYVQGAGPGSDSYHPRVFLAGQSDGRGGFNILLERYRTGEASYEESIEAFRLMCQEYGLPMQPDLVYVDSAAAMLHGALGKAGLYYTKASHPVLEGIRNLRRLICDGKGVRLFHVHPRCANVIREFQMYQYETEGNIPGGERRPAKKDDHGPDCCRYLTYHMRFEA